jgi:hypothetical protein
MVDLKVKPAPGIYACGINEISNSQKLTEKEKDDLKNRACSNLQDKSPIVICNDQLPPRLINFK